MWPTRLGWDLRDKYKMHLMRERMKEFGGGAAIEDLEPMHPPTTIVMVIRWRMLEMTFDGMVL